MNINHHCQVFFFTSKASTNARNCSCRSCKVPNCSNNSANLSDGRSVLSPGVDRLRLSGGFSKAKTNEKSIGLDCHLPRLLQTKNNENDKKKRNKNRHGCFLLFDLAVQ